MACGVQQSSMAKFEGEKKRWMLHRLGHPYPKSNLFTLLVQCEIFLIACPSERCEYPMGISDNFTFTRGRGVVTDHS